ncbi:MAG TPA: putative electron transfer flavoprotein FixA [Anaerolineaceae bacterium]|nr:putative electron transfer flavoprotein FixA [Anaerolineaceae bacterium]
MNIIVCYKPTPDASDIVVRADGSISVERAEWILSPFDLQAVEAGMRLAEAAGGKVMALSVGPRQISNSKLKKDMLSRGPDELYLVVDDALAGADTAVTARVLTQAVRKMGSFDLILFGEGSADLYFQQVGLQVGELLCIPTLNAISKIDLEDGRLVVERSLEDEIEVLETSMPAALSVTTDIALPRLPSLKEILKASKKPVTEWTLTDIDVQGGTVKAHSEIVAVQAPPHVERKKVVLEGKPAEAVQSLVDALQKEGIL